jgi:murein DD-endopeptidase MepM/ murein hydrolase activator NlpD
MRSADWRAAALIGIAATILPAAAARADVYRYVTDGGTDAYTDSPLTGEERLVLRDPPAGDGPARGKGQRRGAAARVASPRAGLPVEGTITSPYGVRNDPLDGLLRLHQGVDIAVPEGTPVRPISPGRVAFAGYRNGHGNVVVVDHEDGRLTLYAHNSVNWVRAGEAVGPDDILALSGSTGRSTGPHLHFELWRDGANVTEAYLRGLEGARSGTGAAGGAGDDLIRRIIQADGTVLFTNLPPGS